MDLETATKWTDLIIPWLAVIGIWVAFRTAPPWQKPKLTLCRDYQPIDNFIPSESYLCLCAHNYTARNIRIKVGRTLVTTTIPSLEPGTEAQRINNHPIPRWDRPKVRVWYIGPTGREFRRTFREPPRWLSKLRFKLWVKRVMRNRKRRERHLPPKD